jgi:hypothetical protein
MSTNQLVAHLPDILEALRGLNKSLFILDMAGLSIAAAQVDAAINNVQGELATLPREIARLDVSREIDFSPLDEMVLILYGST